MVDKKVTPIIYTKNNYTIEEDGYCDGRIEIVFVGMTKEGINMIFDLIGTIREGRKTDGS